MMKMSCDSEQNYKAKQTEDLKNGDHFVFLVPVRLLLSRMVVLYHVPTGLAAKGLLLKGCLSWTIRDKQKENLTLN